MLESEYRNQRQHCRESHLGAPATGPEKECSGRMLEADSRKPVSDTGWPTTLHTARGWGGALLTPPMRAQMEEASVSPHPRRPSYKHVEFPN